ncbi:hypothetical protein [Brevibacterium litoralis]|uniref:hypothetical protein n=1 Tax=Brevibacterium litoralis TaxID=3138935 RepID=UPI0032ECC68B
MSNQPPYPPTGPDGQDPYGQGQGQDPYAQPPQFGQDPYAQQGGAYDQQGDAYGQQPPSDPYSQGGYGSGGAAYDGGFGSAPGAPGGQNQWATAATPQKKTSIFAKWWFWVIAAVLVLLLGGCTAIGAVVINAMNSGGEDPAPTDPTSQEPAPEETEAAPEETEAAPEEEPEEEPEEGGTDEGGSEEGDTQAAPAAEGEAAEWAESLWGTFDEVTFKGDGNDLVEIPDGIDAALVDFSATGGDYSRSLGVDFLDDSNETVASFYHYTDAEKLEGTDVIGEDEYSQGFTKAQIDADGQWEMTLRPIHTAGGLQESGNGGAAFFYEGDAASGEFHVDGDGYTGVDQYYEDDYGVRWDLVVNEAGGYSGPIVLKAGPSLIVVEAEGDWEFTVDE